MRIAEKDKMPGDKKHDVVMGIIISRKCPFCGHHEVGYETVDGTFVPLRHGDRIAVFTKMMAEPGSDKAAQSPQLIVNAQEKDLAHWFIWVPEPLRADRDLCRKYGSLIDTERFTGEMSPALYELAFRQKLQWLIEKEQATPLSVILDRFFAAPHLASGDAKQVADALWQELDEIRAPATRVMAWLRDRSHEALLDMVRPKTMDALQGDILSDDELREELGRMSLEDFFEAL